MIERLIYDVLASGIADIRADERLVRRFFRRQRGLSNEEIDLVLRLFLDEAASNAAGGTPEIHHGYPRADVKFPAWFIILSGENETQEFLGGFAGLVEAEDGEEDGELGEDPEVGLEQHGSIMDSSFMVMTVTRHPDVTLYYYYIARYILMRAHKAMMGRGGLLSLSLSGGDLAPDPRFIPAGFFARQLTVSVRAPEIVVGDAEPRAYGVVGISVDGGSPSDSGGVPTNLTVRA